MYITPAPRWIDLGGAVASRSRPRGKELDLAAKGDVVDQASMWSWGGSRTCRAPVIRAIVIRAILRGRLAADPDPQGLRLRGLGSLADLTWNTSPLMSDLS